MSIGVLAPEEAPDLGEEPWVFGRCRDMEGAVEFLREAEDVWIAITRLAGERFHDDAFDLGAEVQAGACLVEGDRRLGEELREHLPGALRQVREGAGEQEVGDGRQGILIGGGGDELAGESLGGDVHQGTYEVPRPCQALVLPGIGCGRNPEVEELGGSGHGIVHRVVGF